MIDTIYSGDEGIPLLRQPPDIPIVNYQLTAKAKNSSGTIVATSAKIIAITGSYRVFNRSFITPQNSAEESSDHPVSKAISAYPNPVSETLNIGINKTMYDMTRQPITDNTKALKQPVFDIRLYDDKGHLCRQAKIKEGDVQFDVSGLSNGFYVLHVYDGIYDKPAIRKIIIK